jgi:ATP-dependent Lhr-like helicase
VEGGLKRGESSNEIAEKLSSTYSADIDTIKLAISEVVEHFQEGHAVPTDNRIVLENWDDNVIIHANYGTLTNRTLSRILGHLISEGIGYPVGVQQDTYMIIIQTVGEVDADYVIEMLKNLASRDLGAIIRAAVVKTGLFKRRLINVARKAGALSKYADFSNITLGRLMKSFEGTAIFEEALKDAYRLDLDVESFFNLVEKIAINEIEVVKLLTKDEISPLGKMGANSIRFKTDIVPPEKINRIILESAKARLLGETRTFACLGKKNWFASMKVNDLTEKISCPRCGSTEIGVFDRDIPEVSKWQSFERLRSKKDPPKWWQRGKDSSKLVSIYGRRAAIIASAKRVDFSDAWDILAETELESDDFYERIIQAERDALKKRFF